MAWEAGEGEFCDKSGGRRCKYDLRVMSKMLMRQVEY